MVIHSHGDIYKELSDVMTVKLVVAGMPAPTGAGIPATTHLMTIYPMLMGEQTLLHDVPACM